MMRLIPVALALLCLSACGFTPLYGASENAPQVQSLLNAVAIDIIPDRTGQYLRNRLIDRFHTAGTPAAPRYRLALAPVSEQRTNLDITKTSDTTRAQLRLGTGLTLFDSATNEAVLSRSLYSTTSYNILASQFTTRVSEDNARLNALDDLARQVEQQLTLYFKR